MTTIYTSTHVLLIDETAKIQQADEGYYVYIETDNMYFTKGVHLLQPFNTVKDHFNLFHPERNFEKSSYVVIKIDKEVQNPKQYDNGNCFCNVKYISKVLAAYPKIEGIAEFETLPPDEQPTKYEFVPEIIERVEEKTGTELNWVRKQPKILKNGVYGTFCGTWKKI